MAEPTIDDFDIDQLDLSDPATRKFAESRLDLSDPDTKKWWDSTAPQAAPAQTTTSSLEMGADQWTAGDTDPGLSDEDAAEYLAMTRDPRVTGQQIGEWLGKRGKIFTPESEAHLQKYRKAIAEGRPTDDTITYNSVLGDVVPEQKLTPDQDVGAFGASLEQGMALSPMGVVTRLVNDWTDADFGQGMDKETLRQKYPNLSDEGIEALHDSIIGELRKQEKANANFQVEDTGANLGQRIVGNMIGSASPVDIIPIGRGASIGRQAIEAGLQNTLADAVVQGSDVAYGAQDKFDIGQAAQAGAEGTVLGGAIAGAGKLAGPVREPTPEPAPRAPWPKKGTEQIARARQTVEAITSTWENKPSIAVEPNFKKYPDLDKNAIAAVTDDGDIVINLANVRAEAKALGVDPEDVLNAATFHESLGHYGVAEKFGDDLDMTLNEFYNNSKGTFKSDVDKWMKDNPDAYVDDPDPLARAAEEVLAEMSEKGKIDRTMMDALKDKVKAYGRDIGVDLRYSDREIRSILSLAHDTVVKGDATTNPGGVRYMKRRTMGTSEGMAQGRLNREGKEGKSPLGRVRSNRNIDDILEEAEVTKHQESWDEWIDEAGRLKMTGKKAQALEVGADAPQILAAKEFALRSAIRIKDLSQKSANGTLSPREKVLLQREQTRLDNVTQSIIDVIANSARNINAQKIEVASDKALVDNIRNMMRKHDLTTQEGAAAAAKELVKDEKKAKLLEGSLNALGQALNTPRTMMSSLDLSAPLRQGIFLINRKEWWQNLGPMMKHAFSEDYHGAAMKAIENRPTYPQMKKAGLSFTDLGDKMSQREEAFQASWVEKVPALGKLVRGSNRAYTGFLNQLRADTFDSLVKMSEDAGLDVATDFGKVKNIAKFVNAATGRGNLPKSMEGAATFLNGLFFSPRLIASRVRLLADPTIYTSLPPGARKEAVKSLLAFGGIALTVAQLARMAGADVETDPKSSDFMKIRDGDTRYDILGGFGQYITLAARLHARMAGIPIKNAKGETNRQTAYNDIEKFLTNKASPIASYIVGFMKQKTPIGEDFDEKKEAVSRFIPMFAGDLVEMMGKYGVEGAAKVAPAIGGIGVQDYKVKGYDPLGRSYNDDTDGDPVADEVSRLSEVVGKDVLNPVRKNLTIDGKAIELSDDVYYDYQKLAGEYIASDLKEEMATEEWATLPDDEKIAIIKQIARDARADARADLFKDFNVEGEAPE